MQERTTYRQSFWMRSQTRACHKSLSFSEPPVVFISLLIHFGERKVPRFGAFFGIWDFGAVFCVNMWRWSRLGGILKPRCLIRIYHYFHDKGYTMLYRVMPCNTHLILWKFFPLGLQPEALQTTIRFDIKEEKGAVLLCLEGRRDIAGVKIDYSKSSVPTGNLT